MRNMTTYSRIIKDFDNLYPAGRDVNAKYLRELISKNNKIYGEKIWPPEKILELRDFIDRLNPSESYLFNGSGEQLLCVGRESLTSSVKFIRDFF